MTQQEILNSNQTKTWKIEQLLRLGLSRQQVAELVGTNYGFVQNVFANIFPERIRTRGRRELREAIHRGFRLESFTFNHRFGVEIEMFGVSRDELRTELANAGIPIREGQRLTSNTGYWKITSDGSISGNNSLELVSPILEGTQGLAELKTVMLIARGLEGRVNRTCGLHIHLDARDFEFQTWKNLFINYAKIEKHIDSIMPNSRRANNNTYCQSMRVSEFETKIKAARNLGNIVDSVKALHRKITGDSRYYKINASAFWRHGSVEFRQHGGTVDFKKVSNWIKFLARLIEFSKQGTFQTENENEFDNFLDEQTIAYFRSRKQELA
ncbi:MAG: amidoligase family protein [Candidatus Kapabacteria bacterium]|nr:amidoligase family protein [Candidatus Kapabacteria bacterium]